MTTDSPSKSSKPGRGFLLAALVFFVIFAANIVWGKIAITQGATTTPGLGDVGEFLTLFVAVVLFIAACLARERAERADKSGSPNTPETS
ncbi:MAG: hypothetical protein QNJ92_08675 [Alphaproteobacteria bacterium]|nr:hypothetical protein [Alphaproteobacteria bacterium]